MSAVALQRVLVRMLFDPPFVERVHSGERIDGVTPEEHGWLRAADPRAFRIDPYRRSRALAALMEEFPVACALALRQSGVARLDAFFGSPLFHAGMQAGASLSVLFAGHLHALGPAYDGALEMESSLARLRRAMPSSSSAEYCLAPGSALLLLPGGSLDGYRARLEALHRPGRSLLESIMDEGLELPPCTRSAGGGPDRLLLQLGEEGDRIERLPQALFQILSACVEGISRGDLLHRFSEQGAGEREADEIMAEWIDSGLLRRS